MIQTNRFIQPTAKLFVYKLAYNCCTGFQLHTPTDSGVKFHRKVWFCVEGYPSLKCAKLVREEFTRSEAFEMDFWNMNLGFGSFFFVADHVGGL